MLCGIRPVEEQRAALQEQHAAAIDDALLDPESRPFAQVDARIGPERQGEPRPGKGLHQLLQEQVGVLPQIPRRAVE